MLFERSFYLKLFSTLLLASFLLSGCAKTYNSDGEIVDDPYEAQNRALHRFNKNVDRALLRPAAIGYTSVTPKFVRSSLNNVADNFATPSYVLNHLMQGRLDLAVKDSGRFLLNTTIGLGGFFDAAGRWGIERNETDFGETLALWGTGEGAYVELPLLGPSTSRAAVGRAVDYVTNPLTLLTLGTQAQTLRSAATVNTALSFRGEFASSVDGVLYGSADSYSQTKSLYLQRRRHQIASSDGAKTDQTALEEQFESIYEDVYE